MNSDITETINLTPDQVKELPLPVRKLITKYRHHKRFLKNGDLLESIELEFVSKERAVEMLSKHTGFFAKDNDQKTNVKINMTSDEVKEKATKLGRLFNGLKGK